jgi:release factor glutamine methyltransferase
MTLSEALTRATCQLDASPDLRADAARDAATLLRHALGISHATQLADPARALTLDQQTNYAALIQRRLANQPIQYITGEQEFYGLALRVTPAVLIPRPETEHLVEAVLTEMKLAALDCSQPLRILDVGTGSGAIAIALAHHLPQAHVTAVDLSPAALEVAASNAARHALSDRIRILASDLLAAIAPDEAPFDAIVSNPPYVPEADRASLHPQVRDHEPSAALFAGPDGLDLYRRLIPQTYAALKSGGLLALEIGYNQQHAVGTLLSGWNHLRFLDDFQRIPRIVLARRP